jgi:hypothetical protein
MRLLLQTDEDKRRIGAARGQRSMLKAVATAPFQLVRSGASLVAGAAHDGVTSPRSDAGGGVADQWCAILYTGAPRTLINAGVQPKIAHAAYCQSVPACLRAGGDALLSSCRIDFLIQQAEAAQTEAETAAPQAGMPANSNVSAQGAATPVLGSASEN